ncbi:MAG: hypothetical protein CMF77_00830 [Candidatus Marinimicrobia bacterium]|jgi:hypothetical protein|nr:hypothetical protein [Candidatus Neomarinimicrobiota bacterium]|tara:strand:- start:24 stop:221 length:198 start_codon:yes stop_codon:yes gene_type:complete
MQTEFSSTAYKTKRLLNTKGKPSDEKTFKDLENLKVSLTQVRLELVTDAGYHWMDRNTNSLTEIR